MDMGRGVNALLDMSVFSSQMKRRLLFFRFAIYIRFVFKQNLNSKNKNKIKYKSLDLFLQFTARMSVCPCIAATWRGANPN